MMFNKDRTNHYVTRKAEEDMATVNKQRNKSDTDNKQL